MITISHNNIQIRTQHKCDIVCLPENRWPYVVTLNVPEIKLNEWDDTREDMQWIYLRRGYNFHMKYYTNLGLLKRDLEMWEKRAEKLGLEFKIEIKELK